ncbi:MAG TPA: hypothetical protein PLV19_06180 [Nitrosomonas sp.]|nr:hypothetical protein [Nitrosomonas sp.]HQX13744.1 hypothetical protein [Nitrosomonas sp.]HRB32423.1 hypothetical protein [Nitrosomonas sp.]HRB45262.1 hypothetical protein [Nitrosomonas sp.]HRB76394.1 hypothetical protein [Nitrosomonas sp.]
MNHLQSQDELQTNTANVPLSRRGSTRPFYESGQMRRAKMHAARLIDSIDGYRTLPSSLQRLVEACFVLETTDSRVLAAYLKQTPATVRMDFQKICTLLGQKIALQKTHQSIPAMREFA